MLKPVTTRMLLTLGASLAREVEQMDVKISFLHGQLAETVYSIADGIYKGEESLSPGKGIVWLGVGPARMVLNANGVPLEAGFLEMCA